MHLAFLLCRSVCCTRRPAVLLQGRPAERIAGEPFRRGARGSGGDIALVQSLPFHSGDSVSSLLPPVCRGCAACPLPALVPVDSFTTIFSKHGPARGHLYWIGPEITLRSSLFRACAPPWCVSDRRVGRVLEGGLVRSPKSEGKPDPLLLGCSPFPFFQIALSASNAPFDGKVGGPVKFEVQINNQQCFGLSCLNLCIVLAPALGSLGFAAGPQVLHSFSRGPARSV